MYNNLATKPTFVKVALFSILILSLTTLSLGIFLKYAYAEIVPHATEFPLPISSVRPEGIAVGPDGGGTTSVHVTWRLVYNETCGL